MLPIPRARPQRPLFCARLARRALRWVCRGTVQPDSTRPRSPKSAQILPSQMVPNLLFRFCVGFLQPITSRCLCIPAPSPPGSPDDGQQITKASGPATAKSYTNPAVRSRCQDTPSQPRLSRYIGSCFSSFFVCLISADCPSNDCAFGRVAILAAQSDVCVTRRSRLDRRREKPPGTRRKPHEKPDFWHRD